jgi:hypothetical protein
MHVTAYRERAGDHFRDFRLQRWLIAFKWFVTTHLTKAILDHSFYLIILSAFNSYLTKLKKMLFLLMFRIAQTMLVAKSFGKMNIPT